MYTLEYIGIYPRSIRKAVNVAEDALSRVDLDNYIDELNEGAIEMLKEVGDWSQITNSIIFAYFTVARDIIESKAEPNKDEDKRMCEIYVNGYDSHFYIDGEEVFTDREYDL